MNRGSLERFFRHEISMFSASTISKQWKDYSVVVTAHPIFRVVPVVAVGIISGVVGGGVGAAISACSDGNIVGGAVSGALAGTIGGLAGYAVRKNEEADKFFLFFLSSAVAAAVASRTLPVDPRHLFPAMATYVFMNFLPTWTPQLG